MLKQYNSLVPGFCFNRTPFTSTLSTQRWPVSSNAHRNRSTLCLPSVARLVREISGSSSSFSRAPPPLPPPAPPPPPPPPHRQPRARPRLRIPRRAPHHHFARLPQRRYSSTCNGFLVHS